MSAASGPEPSSSLSIVSGPALSEEPGLGELTLPGFLREVTGSFAEREALVLHGPDGATRWSYAELWEHSMEVARALRACGVGKGSRVGVLMTNRPEWLAAVFGTSLVGAVAVPLSTFSTPPELEYMLQASCVSALLFEGQVLKKDFAQLLVELEPEIAKAEPGTLQSARFPYLRRLAVFGEGDPGGAIESWEDFLSRGHGEPTALVEATAEAVQPSDTALLMFSSGSTAKPKGMLNAHRGVAIQLWRFRRLCGFGPDDDIRCWSANGFFWSGNFVQALGPTLAAGGSLVLQRTFDADEAMELIGRERVSYPVAWPHQWPQLEAAPSWNDADLSNLRFADYELTPFRKQASFPDAKWISPFYAYGATETFTLTTAFPANTPKEEIANSWGRVLPGVTIKIIDPFSGQVLPRGEPGEICVKGPTLMLGYLGTPLDETLDSEGFLRSGDGGYFDEEGRLCWEGRLNDIIKTGGANVAPMEVNEVLLSHPGVKLSQIVGIPHDTLGEEVVACVVCQAGASLEAEELRGFLKESLASYKVPRRVLFFRQDEIELTGTNSTPWPASSRRASSASWWPSAWRARDRSPLARGASAGRGRGRSARSCAAGGPGSRPGRDPPARRSPPRSRGSARSRPRWLPRPGPPRAGRPGCRRGSGPCSARGAPSPGSRSPRSGRGRGPRGR